VSILGETKCCGPKNGGGTKLPNDDLTDPMLQSTQEPGPSAAEGERQAAKKPVRGENNTGI